MFQGWGYVDGVPDTGHSFTNPISPRRQTTVQWVNPTDSLKPKVTLGGT